MNDETAELRAATRFTEQNYPLPRCRRPAARRVHRCGRCGGRGHNRQTCLIKAAPTRARGRRSA